MDPPSDCSAKRRTRGCTSTSTMRSGCSPTTRAIRISPKAYVHFWKSGPRNSQQQSHWRMRDAHYPGTSNATDACNRAVAVGPRAAARGADGNRQRAAHAVGKGPDSVLAGADDDADVCRGGSRHGVWNTEI